MVTDAPHNRPDMKRPRTISAVEAIGITGFGVFTIIGLINAVWPQQSSLKTTLIVVLSISTLVSIYIVLASFRGVIKSKVALWTAAILPSVLILLEAGAIITVLANGANSPFGGALEGISGPLVGGLVPFIPWPASFVIGASLGGLLIYWISRPIPNSEIRE